MQQSFFCVAFTILFRLGYNVESLLGNFFFLALDVVIDVLVT